MIDVGMVPNISSKGSHGPLGASLRGRRWISVSRAPSRWRRAKEAPNVAGWLELLDGAKNVVLLGPGWHGQRQWAVGGDENMKRPGCSHIREHHNEPNSM